MWMGKVSARNKPTLKEVTYTDAKLHNDKKDRIQNILAQMIAYSISEEQG